MLLGALLCMGAAKAQTAASSPQVPDAHPSTTHPAKKPAGKRGSTPAASAAATPAPPPPDWPMNDQPGPATIAWDKQALKIDAANSSLQQILGQVSSETGAKVEGLGQDERVFGDYGPGPARDVLSQLLQGSGYNVMLAGDMGDGVPREVVLSPRRAGAAPSQTQHAQPEETEEDIPAENEVDTQPQAPPVVQPRPGFPPDNQPGPARTPQQLMQEMQQRQMQMQQQMQQQQQQAQPPNNQQQ